MARRLLVAIFAALFVVGIAACGDDGGIEEETTTTADEEETTTTEDDGEDGEDEGGDDGAQQPGDLGDGAEFDALADACFDGDMVACDILYAQTPLDSNSEAYGDTCGGRLDEAEDDATCVEDFDFEVPEPQAPGSLGDDDDLDELAEECHDGELDSCDDLYEDSPAGSSYEAYGVTCGGRLPSASVDVLVDLAVSAGVQGFCEEAYENAT